MVYPENIEEIKKFAKEIKLDVKYLLGEKYEGKILLLTVAHLPANIVFNVNCNLGLNYVYRLPSPIVFNVGEHLFLRSLKSLPSSTIFNVGGKIYLPSDHKVKVIWS